MHISNNMDGCAVIMAMVIMMNDDDDDDDDDNDAGDEDEDDYYSPYTGNPPGCRSDLEPGQWKMLAAQAHESRLKGLRQARRATPGRSFCQRQVEAQGPATGSPNITSKGGS